MEKKVKILMLSLAVFMAGDLMAQTKDEGKIKVEITKEVNGEKKTFKGEYNSTEEMRADPNYQEFAGKEDGFNFWFDGSSDEDMMIQLDRQRDQNKSFFRFFHGDGEEGENSFFFKHFDDDSEDSFFDIQLDGMDMEEYREKMKELGMEMEHLFDKLHSDDDRHVRVIEIKRIKVEEVDDEFGKKGKVEDSNKLVLDDLSFYPNPSSNGRFKVRFNVPSEDELTIKVSNLEGKEVFNRYFESFSGTYYETIDLSGQREGIYLLEISQGKKRLTKKIVIN
ncbi:T9SS type A sorting domain-containing protein [Ekhidna sp.]|uniref:T9SS type A sorting domain-containing protein n=1 Tax=Ekhidna sp. TaxID=2608089 RepID=UPI0035119AD5